MHQLKNRESSVQQAADSISDSTHLSPWRFLIITIGGIFLAELIAMLLISDLQDWPYLLQSLLDATIMAVLIFPVVYYFSLRPLLLHIEKRHQAEEQLREMALFPELNPNPVLQVDAWGIIKKSNPAARQMNLGPDGQLFELIPDLKGLDLHVCIATGAIWHIDESRFGERFLQWTVQGAPEFGLVFLYSTDITERKRSQETVLLLSSVVEQTADSVVVTDCAGMIQYVNPAFERLTGYAKEEAIGLTPRVLKSGIHDRQFYKMLWDTVLNGQIFHGEISNRRKNGEIFHEVKTITPLRNERGDITRLVATGKDITEHKVAEEKLRKAYEELELRVQQRTEDLRLTNLKIQDEIAERKRAEMKLRRSEERYRSLFNSMTEGFALHEIICDQTGVPRDYRFLELNQSFERLTGLDRESTIGRTIKELLPDVEPSWIERYGKVALTRQPIHFMDYIATTKRWYEIYCYSPAKNQFAVLFFDITDRRKAEEQLHYQAALLSNVNDAIVASDADYCLTTWNSAAESLYGWKAEEVLGHNGLEILRTVWPGIEPDKMRRAITETGRWRGEATQVRRDGTRFPVEVSSIVLYDERSQVTGYVSVNRDITERKHSEEALRQSQLDLARAQDVGRIGSWRLDVRKNELTWSDENHRIFGIPKGTSMTYETFLSTIHPDDLSYVDAKWNKALKGETYDIEHRIIANGETKWVREKAYLEFDQENNLQGGFGITQDITERKQAEQTLRESESKYRNLFENMSEEVHFWQLVRDEDGRIKTWRLVDANPPTLKTWGRTSVEEIRGKTTDEIFGPGATEHYMPIVRKIMTEGTSYSYEDYFSNLDKYFRFTTVPLGDYFITTGADITSIKKAEHALRAAHDELEIRVRERTAELAAANLGLSKEIAERWEIERQLRIQTAAMDAAANGIIITDPKGIMLWTNPAMTQISGYPGDELIGHSTRLFNSGKNEPDFYRQMWDTILAGNVWRGETTNRRKDGSLYIEEQTITPVHNETGQLTHYIAIKQDVTERKLIYAQLEESNQELKTLTASERQQRFLAEGLVESSVVLNMSLELYAVLDHIFEQTRRILPYLKADIVLIDGELATVVRQWWTDEYSDERTIFENDTLNIHGFPVWERICATKSAVMVPDTGSEDDWQPYFGMNWVRSYLGAPLIYNDQIIGIINLVSDQANAFQEFMVKTLEAFAAPAAVAIQNARLYENEQQNRKIAEILSAASVALTQTLDTQMVMETILDYMQFVMPLNVAFVVLNEGDERYRIRTVRTDEDHISARDSLLDQTIDMLSEPIVRSYFTKHESTFIPDSRELSAWEPPFELSLMNCWLGIPLESMGKVLGIVVMAHAVPDIFTRKQIQLAETVVKQAVVALQNAWLFEQVRSGRERLQQLSRHLVEIQENERKYIARELHDETSQSLTSLKMGLQVIEKEADRRVKLAEQVRNLQALADETLESLHHLAVNLRPASLDHLGLVDALTSLMESTRQRSGLQAHFKIIGSMEMASLTDEMKTSIYRIVQESITNVIRHAHATCVDVILEWQSGKILIVIEDDGVGIDMQKAREVGHLGLIGMQERAEMLGGKLLVDSTPQVGTTLVVEIPYANSNPYRR